MLVSPCLVLSLLSLLSQVQAGDRVEHPRSLIYLFGNILQWPERMEPKVEEKRVEQPSCEFLITKWTKWSNPGPGLAATIDLPVLRDIESWTIVLEFNKNFSKLNFFNALSGSSSGSTYELKNESWSGKKKAGDHVKFSLLGDYEDGEEGQEVTVTSITLNDEVLCLASN